MADTLRYKSERLMRKTKQEEEVAEARRAQESQNKNGEEERGKVLQERTK